MIVPMGTIMGLSALLFGIGAFGFLARRNIILMVVSIEVMLNAVNLSLAGFSHQLNDSRGQVLALLVIAVAAAEVVGAADARTQSQRVGGGEVANMDVIANAGAVGGGVVGAEQGKGFALAEGGL